jgi:hypothetical protein
MTVPGKITDFLVVNGWVRSSEWEGEECGYIGDNGVCIKSARWAPPGHTGLRKPLCAQHARITESERPDWERKLIRENRI